MTYSLGLTTLVVTLFIIYALPKTEGNRTFVVDWDNDQFLKDGEPFRFISGSFHYFRAHPDTWQRKLRTLRASGLNAVTTYVEWSMHNPLDGVYVWNGIADLEKFIKLAVAEDLLVVLRPGPYICAERDFGGFPFWLYNKYPAINLRTSDINYLYEVRIWYAVLMNKLSPYLYGNGGPIIMVQVENEYGSYFACDKTYRLWLRNETAMHVGDKAVLFTNDGPDQLGCGAIENVLATMDFGSGGNLTTTWGKLRKIMPKGPLVNAEFYPGWLTHWSESIARVSTDSIIPSFTNMLNDGASVNFYMFYGGSNFGYTSGANNGGPGSFQPDITSYDYDAPMDEAGDPTPKYFALREVIGKYLPLPNISVPEPLPKKNYGAIRLVFCCTMLSPAGRKTLGTGTVISSTPKTFEYLHQYSGMVLYETLLPTFKKDPTILHVAGLRDRAYVFVDGEDVGLLSRETPIYSLPLSSAASNAKLQLLVENQGRINFADLTDIKGITADITLDSTILMNWNMTKFPFESYADIKRLIKIESASMSSNFSEYSQGGRLRHGPGIYYGVLNIEDEPCDTYLDTTGWGKGSVFVNGENLGRYWPLTGPQITLYVPREVLKTGANEIVVIEYQRAAEERNMTFVDHHIWS